MEISSGRYEAQARLEAILKAAVDAIVVIDERGQIELFSTAAERLFGWRAAEVIGKNVSMLMPEPYRGEHDSYLSNYLESGTPKIIGIGREVQAKDRNGEAFPVELSVGEIASHGQGKRFVGIIRDIRDKRNAENEARELRDRLAHVGRLSTLGEMAGGIAHEINQPLTAIAAYAQALSRGLNAAEPPTASHLDALNRIASEALRAAEVITRVRHLARRDPGTTRDCDLNQLVRDLLALAEVDAGAHGVELWVELASDLPQVHADEIQIQQIVLNLVRNAIDSTRLAPPNRRRVDVSSTAHAGWAEIRVADGGEGVPEDVRSSIFDPFFTTKKEGLGLGLSLSRGIAESHGGSLSLEPSATPGATFVLRLPVSAPPTEEGDASE